MDFELTPDQVDLRDGIRTLLEGRFPMATVRSLEQSGGVTPHLWAALADAGVFTMRLPEADGGVGLGMAEAVLVFEELGRFLVPGPLVATELARGNGVVGVVDRDAAPVVVEHGDALDRLFVIDDDGVWIVEPKTLQASPVDRPLDPLTPLWTVSALPAGERAGDRQAALRWRRDGAVLTAALQVGIASALTEMAVTYANERTQFGRPIGGFQAVKHMLADMLVRAEVARAAVYAAGVTIDQPDVGDIGRAVSTAKLTAGDAAVRNGKAAIQVLGGMGFTWEVDAHLYLKRAWVLETHFGGVDHHAELLAHSL